MVRSTNAQIAGQIAEIYSVNAIAEQILEIEVWIDNIWDQELIVNDMEHGLVWYLQPSNSVHFKIHNPDAAFLRISDIHNDQINFVTATAGSSVRKERISYEDDECWVANIYNRIGDTYDMANGPIAYSWISKQTYETKVISMDEFEKFKKEMKEKHKEAK